LSADEPPDLTLGQVEARIRIARRFLQLDGRTAATWDDPPPPPAGITIER